MSSHQPAVSVQSALSGTASESLQLPGYDRSALRAGIVHIGVGNFHRVHQAVYVDRCLHLPGHSGWGLVGVGLGDSDAARAKATAFTAQHGLYTVTDYAPDGARNSRLITAMTEHLHAPSDPPAVLDRLSDPSVRIVTLTITEGGYNLDEATGQFRADEPGVAADLRGGPPRTAFGFLTEALRLRRDAGVAPFTVVSCDNLRGNGDTARTATVGFAAARDPSLAAWIADTVAFPNSMVDRIAPIVDAGTRHRLNAATGVDDALPALAEDFTQWVLEDIFPAGRPRWEDAGVELRGDVHAFETVKGRLLNASHVLLSYPAALAGYGKIHEAVADPALSGLLVRFMDEDVAPLLTAPPGVSLSQYQRQVIARFSNPHVPDQVLRVAHDGAAKIPVFHRATLETLLGQDRDVRRPALLVAAFRRYLQGVDDQGRTFAVHEPNLSGEDRQLLTATDPLAGLQASPFRSWGLGDSARFTDAYLASTSTLGSAGALAAAAEACRA